MLKKRKKTTKKAFTRKSGILCNIGFLLMLTAGMGIGCIIDSMIGMEYLFAGPFELLGAAGCCVIAKDKTGEKLTEHIRHAKFDISVPIMLMLFDYSAGEILTHIIGVIGSCFTSVTPDVRKSELYVLILSAVIFAPLCEEIVFRFCNISVLKNNWSKTFTVIFTGMIFAVVHLYNFVNTANVFLGGVLYAYVFITTGSLLYTMLAHAAHNALCIIDFDRLTLAGQKISTQVNGFTLYSTPWLIINGVLVTVGLVYYFTYFRPRYCEKKNEILIETAAV